MKYYTPDELIKTIGHTSKQMSMFSINCRSINANWDSLNELFNNMSNDRFHFDIIALTEVFKLHDGFNYHIDGYHEILSNTRDDLDDGHGGVALYINENKPYHLRDDLTVFIPHVLESLFVEVQINSKKSIIIGVIYRPNTQPRADLDEFTDNIYTITSKISTENKHAYIMGDFNIDLLKFRTHEKTNDFINSMITKGYLPLITKPTRITAQSATLIDHIYSNYTHHNYESGIVISDVADHFGTFYVSRKTAATEKPKYKFVRQMNQNNIKYFNDLLSSADFSSVLLHDCPNEAYDALIDVYKHSYDVAFPIKRIKLTRKYVKREQWITQGILNSSINKIKLLRNKTRNPSVRNVTKYKEYCKLFNKIKRMAKNRYYTEVFAQNVNNIKRTWQLLRDAINIKSCQSAPAEAFIVGDKEITNKQDIANSFNTFFSNIGSKISEGVPKPLNNFSAYLKDNHPGSFFMGPTNPEEIISVVKALKTSFSRGFDNISMQTAKSTIHHIVAPLVHIFNRSFLTGVVPDNMKIAKILPIFKTGNKKILNNYRPISILPVFSKLLEKLVCNRLVQFLETHNLLFKHQYGFRKNHSTIQPILQLLKDISNANDKNTKDVTLAIFLDLSKAFDTISHNILIHKLDYYGIRGVCNNWFANYLSNRKQYTEINEHKSALVNITTGVPQGSILGPILFLIYINDIHKSSNLKLLCFADDTTAYQSGHNTKDLITDANAQLKQLYDWLCCNKLSLNVKKTYYTIFRPPSNVQIDINAQLCINNEPIKLVGETDDSEAVKFLGIYIDKHLSWHQHVKYVCSSVSKYNYLINRAKHFLPHSALKSLYFGLIQSRLQYGIEVWGNSNHVQKIFVVQKRAIRIINNKAYYRYHTDPLFKSNQILKISNLYNLRVSLFMHDLTRHKLPGSFDDYIKMGNETNYTITTRQHQLIYKSRPRTKFSSRLPIHQFTNIWNQLDDYLQRCNSKIKLKHELRKCYLDSYQMSVRCHNIRCEQCFPNFA